MYVLLDVKICVPLTQDFIAVHVINQLGLVISLNIAIRPLMKFLFQLLKPSIAESCSYTTLTVHN